MDGHTDGRTDGRADGRENSIPPPPQTKFAGGITSLFLETGISICFAFLYFHIYFMQDLWEHISLGTRAMS